MLPLGSGAKMKVTLSYVFGVDLFDERKRMLFKCLHHQHEFVVLALGENTMHINSVSHR